MKKIFWVIAAILICGTMFVSCTKETDTVETTSGTATQVNPADLVGTWGGTFSGSATFQGAPMTYNINWTVTLSTSSAGTILAVVNTPGYDPESTPVNYIITGVRPRQNTDYVILDVKRDGFTLDDSFELLYNKSANTLTGSMTLLFQEDLTIGGETTFRKR